LAEIDAAGARSPGVTATALNHLAHTGQLIHDLSAGVYRWRQIMPRALGEAELGPENAEVVASREIISRRRVTVESRVAAPSGGTIYVGQAESKPVELLIDNGVIVGQLPDSATDKEQLGLLLAKNSPLTACVTEAVDALRADGTLAKLQDEWLAQAGAPVLS